MWSKNSCHWQLKISWHVCTALARALCNLCVSTSHYRHHLHQKQLLCLNHQRHVQFDLHGCRQGWVCEACRVCEACSVCDTSETGQVLACRGVVCAYTTEDKRPFIPPNHAQTSTCRPIFFPIHYGHQKLNETLWCFKRLRYRAHAHAFERRRHVKHI